MFILFGHRRFSCSLTAPTVVPSDSDGRSSFVGRITTQTRLRTALPEGIQAVLRNIHSRHLVNHVLKSGWKPQPGSAERLTVVLHPPAKC